MTDNTPLMMCANCRHWTPQPRPSWHPLDLFGRCEIGKASYKGIPCMSSRRHLCGFIAIKEANDENA